MLIMEETGTSRNCALCTGELSGAPAIKYKYMCDKALNHMYAVADNKDAVVADNKGAVAHNKGAAAPSLKSVFVPIDMSIDRPIPIGPMEVCERPKIDERLYQRVDKQPVERQKRGGVTETELKAAVKVSAMRAEAKVVEEERAKVVEEERAKVVGEASAEVVEEERAEVVGEASAKVEVPAKLERICRDRAALEELQGQVELQPSDQQPKRECRRRLLALLAFGYGTMEKDAALCATPEELDKLLLRTVRKPIYVLRNAAQLSCHERSKRYDAHREQTKRRAKHGNTALMLSAKKSAELLDATGERARQIWTQAKFLSTAKLKRKVKTMMQRARCPDCINETQRCDECYLRQLNGARKLACVDLHHCDCNKDSLISGKTWQIKHSFEQWRWRVCSSTAKCGATAVAPDSMGCGQVRHRDLNSVAQLGALVVIDKLCNGRSGTFCRSPV